MWKGVQKEWYSIPITISKILADSMPRQIAKVLENNGDILDIKVRKVG